MAAGDSVLIECSSTNDIGVFYWSWYNQTSRLHAETISSEGSIFDIDSFDSRVIESSFFYSLFALDEVTVEDSGLYTCAATCNAKFTSSIGDLNSNFTANITLTVIG